MIRPFLLAAFAWTVTAFAADDVALINHLAGDASYVSAGAKPARAAPYMKVRDGDRFTLPAGAQLRLVYLKGGRQESFTGPARFTVGAGSSTVQGGAQPQVSTLPSAVSQRIAQTPELMSIAKLGRAGGVAVRSGAKPQPLTAGQKAEVKEARATYRELRQKTARGDITPELFLYAVLDEQGLYPDMKAVVSEMRRRQPDNADLAAMAEYVEAKSQGR